MHHRRVGVGRIDALDLAEVGGILRSRLRIGHPLDGERHVVRSELAEPLVPPHAMSQVEGPGAPVGRHLPLLRKLALELIRLDARRAVRRTDQRVVGPPGGELVAVADAIRRIHRTQVALRHADPGDGFNRNRVCQQCCGSGKKGGAQVVRHALSPRHRSWRAGLASDGMQLGDTASTNPILTQDPAVCGRAKGDACDPPDDHLTPGARLADAGLLAPRGKAPA